MSLDTQFITMFMMLWSGIYLGMAIDTFRRFERYWKKQTIFAFSIEIFFWLLQGLIVFYFLFVANQGELRLYIFLLILCGFAMYQALFKTIFRRILEKLISFGISFIRFIKRLFNALIYSPLRWMIRLLIKILLGIWVVVVWLLLLVGKIILLPLKLVGKIIWWLTPKIVKNYFQQLKGIYSKIENILLKWWKKFRQKRR
ncbi:spore cortex biosynthesis protein YabQ [Pontibacillus yanchengensis]|uniref:Spore cortex biosynthesis protein YabQ n=2 Tax=Pontibacillus yanchengensis TaxID=462910 RepID=A0ACC7VMN3_9BACI|nr:spore cortex biosynthesis protein YabQ [Pontibacillus yanchengensis]MYL35959.1 spore cortex biosynthesis protein YabQ [Pontibacillus yanchengensis]MYL55779.1 spore cortex biosynthesis protein YabQ [Pontibacillus yanchengensis]